VSGWAGWAGLLAGKKKKGPVGQKRAEMKKGGEREGEGEERVLFFLKKILSNSFFKHSNSNQTKKSMHSNHDAQALIISNYFSDV
jgi:hypothetical protein